MLGLLHDEFKLVMALTGCTDVSQIGPHLLGVRGSDGLVRPVDAALARAKL